MSRPGDVVHRLAFTFSRAGLVIVLDLEKKNDEEHAWKVKRRTSKTAKNKEIKNHHFGVNVSNIELVFLPRHPR